MSTPIPSRNPYFGDLHVHTAWSLDAYVMAALNGPDEAFRFAKGEPTRSSLMNAEESRLQRPLDFSAVTDHAEWLGESGVIMDEGYTSDNPEVRKRLATYRNSRIIREDGRAGDFSAMVEIMYSGMIDPDPKRVNFGPADKVTDAAKTIWRRMVEIANAATIEEINAAADYFSALTPRSAIRVAEALSAPKTRSSRASSASRSCSRGSRGGFC